MEESMEQTQNNPTGERNSFKRKLGNTTYNVTVHFNENSTETFEDKVKRLIINACMEERKKA